MNRQKLNLFWVTFVTKKYSNLICNSPILKSLKIAVVKKNVCNSCSFASSRMQCNAPGVRWHYERTQLNDESTTAVAGTHMTLTPFKFKGIEFYWRPPASCTSCPFMHLHLVVVVATRRSFKRTKACMLRSPIAPGTNSFWIGGCLNLTTVDPCQHSSAWQIHRFINSFIRLLWIVFSSNRFFKQLHLSNLVNRVLMFTASSCI